MRKLALHGKYGEGKFAKVDDDDFNLVTQWRWVMSKKGYVIRYTKERQHEIYLHRVIAGAGKERLVTISNGDCLDLRKRNLIYAGSHTSKDMELLRDKETGGIRVYLTGKNGKDKYALVDDADFEMVSQYRWYYQKGKGKKTGYARHGYNDKHGQKKEVLLHRFILNLKPEEQFDHWNGNGLDCRKSNLRRATTSQNMQNKSLQRNNKLRIKGVTLRVHKKKSGKIYVYYQARIRVRGILHSLGYYKNPEKAALAYDEAARKYFGEFARLNFPI